MSDHYLNDKGEVDFIEGTKDEKSKRVFAPIGFFGSITVYEQVVTQAPIAVTPTPPDQWEC